MRFMRYILYVNSGFRIRVSHHELTSALEGKPVKQEILDLLNSEEYKRILSFFEERVTFIEERNPTGIYKSIVRYADENGERIKQPITITNEFGEETTANKIIGYKPNDPEEYVIIMIDHISLISEERGMDKRDTIKKLSEYMKEVRNLYRYIPVCVQQQSAEIQSMDAFKLNRISPTPGALSDCKDTKNDCNVMIGLTNPYAAKLKNFLGYDITKLKDNARFIEIMLSRDGSANSVKALYFDGAVSYFKELPSPESAEYESYMERVYSTIERLRQ